jgi:uncharacterized repeat protein (TIGR01451 family)
MSQSSAFRAWLFVFAAVAQTPAVALSPSSVTLTASPNPSTYGQPVVLTASVTAGATGKVTFYDGVTVLGGGTISQGTASLSTIALPSGVRSLHAYYQGDGGYAPTSSTVTSETVVANSALLLRRPVTYNATGGGLLMATADFNGDGKLDVAVAASYNSLTVFLGDGGGGYLTSASYTLPFPAGGMVVADFNGDGRPDLAVTIPHNGTVLVYLSNADGSLQTPNTFYAGLNPTALAAGDFNGDGNVDLAIGDYYGTTVTILLGNGDGTLSFAAPYTVHMDPYSILTGDFNGDGRTDLAVVTDEELDILIGAGDGTFKSGATYPIGDYVLVGDFNGDGHADLLVFGSSVYVLPGKGDGTFGAAIQSTASNFFTRGSLGDFNGDGITDLVVFDSASVAVAVLYGKGDGTFQAPVEYPAPDPIASMVVGDFNGDGRTDVLISDYITWGLLLFRGSLTPDPPRSDPAISVSHISGLTPGQTGAYYTITVTNEGLDPTAGEITVNIALPSGLTATGLSGSGWSCSLGSLQCSRSDALGGQDAYPNITLIFNVAANISGTLTVTFTVAGGSDTNPNNNVVTDTPFVHYPTVTTLAVSPDPARSGSTVTLTATVTAGATGSVAFYDGTSSIGVAALVSGTAQITMRDLPSGVQSLQAQYGGDNTYGPSTSAVRVETITSSSNGLLPPVSLQTGLNPRWVGMGDFNGDGIPDLVTVTNSGISVFPGKGDGTFGTAVNTAGTPGGNSGLITDFNGDGKLDVAVAGVNGIWIFMGNGDGTFAASQISTFDSASLVSADFNNDGKPDLAALVGGFIYMSLGNGDGTFQGFSYPLGGTTCGGLATADLNGDGRPDLIGLECPTGLLVFLATPTGGFQLAYSGTTGSPVPGIAVADFNGDGKLDIAISNSSGIVVFLGNGDGTLKNAIQSTLSTGGGDNFLIAVDFNGDGNLDLGFIGAGNQAFIAFGNGDGTFSTAVAIHTPGNSFSLVPGDFNLDGREDLAVTNVSTNPEATSDSISLFFGTQYSGLTIAGTHRGRFTAGQTGTYLVTVTNYEFATATGTVQFADTLPAGLTATAISGDGWNCVLATVTCTRSDGLLFGASYPVITVTVGVSGSLTPSVLTNLTQVSNAGAVTQSSDPTDIVLPSVTTLNVTPIPANLGQLVTLTASVTAGATGICHFFDGTSYLGGASLSDGQATLTSRLMAAGHRELATTYSGDGNYAASYSTLVIEQVDAAPSSGLNPPRTFATGANPVALAMGDFNGDGWPDLVTANQSDGTVSILLSNGDGTFGNHRDFPACPAPFVVLAADFNNDGITDLAVSSATTTEVCILLGNGDGTFQAPLSLPVSYYGAPIAVADYWGDDNLDLLAGDGNDLSVISVNGAALQGTSEKGFLNAMGFLVGDFNNDRKIDVLALAGNFFDVYLGNGAGGFQQVPYNSPVVNGAILGDINGDGKLDIIAMANGSIDVILGNGDGTFQAPLVRSTDNPPWELTMADVNGDGKLDIVSSNGVLDSVGVFLGNGDGTLQAPSYYFEGAAPGAIVSGDWNGDGATDIAVANSQANSISVFLGAKLPVLAVGSSHADPFGLGETGAEYTITVFNNGPGVTAGAVTVSDTLPAGLTATAIAGTGWNCTLATLMCTRGDSLAAGTSYPAITLTLNVATNAPASGANTVSVSGGTAAGATASDSTTMIVGAATTIETIPSGLQFSVDNKAPMVAPGTLYLTQGTHMLAVATPQSAVAATQYAFTNWSDSGAATHSINVTGTAATYTATFKTQYQLTTVAFPMPGGTVTPVTGSFFDSGTTVTVTASPNSPYTFDGWSGAGSGSANPASIDMTAAQSITANFGVPGFTCAVTGDGTASVTDVQLMINEALGIDAPGHDLNRDGVVNLADVQKVIDAMTGLGCIY